MSYITLEIRMTRDQGPEPERTYLVSVSEIKSDGRANRVRAAFTMPMDMEQRIHQLLIDTRLRDTRSLEGQAMVAKKLGIELFNSLFQLEVKRLYDRVKARAVKEQYGICLRLRIVPAELSTLPWELLHDGERYLCLSSYPKILFARMPDAIVTNETLNYDPPLRLLGIAACPHEHDELNVKSEKDYINTALEKHQQEKRVEVEWEKAKVSVLSDLRFGNPWHVLHFSGHGYFDKESKEGKIILEDAQGKGFEFDANRLKLALHSDIQLVFLNACDTARGDPLDYLSNFAYRLAISGVPAIVAMQFKITDDAAIQFARVFYDRIARGDAVDEAVTEARHHICVSTRANSLEWIAPVLYISAANSVLFKEAEKEVPPIEESGNLPATPVGGQSQWGLFAPSRRTLLVGGSIGALGLVAATSSLATFTWFNSTQKKVIPFPLAVGGKLDNEAILLTEMYILLLTHAGFEVTGYVKLGDDVKMFNSIKAGYIDIYPEFVITGLQWLKEQPTEDPEQNFQIVKKGFRDNYQLIWLEQAAHLDDNYCVVMLKTLANQFKNVQKISDLVQRVSSSSFVLATALDAQTTAIPLLSTKYNFDFNVQNSFSFDEGGALQAIRGGEAQAAVCSKTDPLIKADDLIVLEDDKKALPPDPPSPVVRSDVLWLDKEGRIANALRPLTYLLTTDVSIQLQQEIRDPHLSAHEVALRWLQGHDLLR